MNHLVVWMMWKTHPPFLWKNDRLEDCYVDDVENLSTAIVENSPMDDSSVDDVENLSTAIVENSKSFVMLSPG